MGKSCDLLLILATNMQHIGAGPCVYSAYYGRKGNIAVVHRARRNLRREGIPANDTEH